MGIIGEIPNAGMTKKKKMVKIGVTNIDSNEGVELGVNDQDMTARGHLVEGVHSDHPHHHHHHHHHHHDRTTDKATTASGGGTGAGTRAVSGGGSGMKSWFSSRFAVVRTASNINRDVEDEDEEEEGVGAGEGGDGGDDAVASNLEQGLSSVKRQGLAPAQGQGLGPAQGQGLGSVQEFPPVAVTSDPHHHHYYYHHNHKGYIYHDFLTPREELGNNP